MFASKVTQDVPLVSDPSITVTVRKLSWLQLKSARQASVRESAKGLADMGGATFVREMRELNATADHNDTDDTATPDPLTQYDMHTVLVCGVRAWTSPAAVTPEALDDLELSDAEGLARAILALSLPTRTEAEQGNA